MNESLSHTHTTKQEAQCLDIESKTLLQKKRNTISLLCLYEWEENFWYRKTQHEKIIRVQTFAKAQQFPLIQGRVTYLNVLDLDFNLELHQIYSSHSLIPATEIPLSNL